LQVWTGAAFKLREADHVENVVGFAVVLEVGKFQCAKADDLSDAIEEFLVAKCAVTAAQLSTLDHAPTRAAAIAERGFLAALDAGCTAPVGALAALAAEPGAGAAVRLSGLIAAPDGSSVIRAQLVGGAAGGEALGRRLAQVLLAGGGAALLDRTSCRAGQRPPGRDAALPFTYYR